MSENNISPEIFNPDYLTIYQLLPENEPANKRAWVNDDGTIETAAGRPIEHAIARTVHVPDINAMVALLRHVGSQRDLVLGNSFAPGTENGEPYRVLSGKRLTELRRQHGLPTRDDNTYPGWQEIDGHRYLQRLKANMRLSSWMLLDKDVDEAWPQDLLSGSESDWLAALDNLLPGVSTTALVAVPSAKQRIQLDGQPLSRNWHYWVQAQDADDIPRATTTIIPRATLNGLAFERTSSGGGRLRRTIVDTSAFSINRLAYDGRPVVKGERLRVVEVPPRVINPEGGRLDTTRVSDLTDEELAVCKTHDLYVSRDRDGVSKATSIGELTDETVIETKVGVMTVAEYAESQHGKLRCQVPEALTGRRSTSWNGILNRTKDGAPTFFDNGTGVRYVRRMDADQMFDTLDDEVVEDDDLDDWGLRADETIEAPVTGELAESVRAALQDPSSCVVINASKGGGKTVEICRDAVARTIAGETCVIATQAVSTCDEAYAHCKRCAQEAGAKVRIVAAYGREGDAQHDEDDDGASSSRSPSAKITKDIFHKPVIVIVAHALLGRRGIEAKYFNLHPRMLESASLELPMNLYIDEADEFLEARGEFIQLDSRVYHQSPKHKFDVSICKARKIGPSACEKCHLAKGTLSVGYDGLGALTHRNQSKEGWMDRNFVTMEPLIGSNWGVTRGETYTGSVYRRTSLHVDPIAGALAKRVEDDDFHAEILSDTQRQAALALRRRMEDWMHPAIWSQTPYQTERGPVWPGMICEGEFLAGIDLGPLKWLGRLVAKGVRVRLATGTWDRVHAEMLRQAGLTPKTITAQVEAPKMDEVLLVALNDHLVQSRRWSLVRSLQGQHRVLNFLARKQAIWYDSNRAPPDIFQKRYESRGYHIDSSRDDDHHDILTTYVRSSLGRGVNLPDYDVVIVEADATQPAATTLAAGETIGDHVAAVTERAARIIDQAVFRVMRRRPGDTGRRVVLLHNLPAEENHRRSLVAKVRREIESRSQQSHFVQAKTALAVEEYAHAFLFEQLPPHMVTLSIAALPKKEQRALRAEMKESDTIRQLEKVVGKAAVMIEAGGAAKAAAKATNWTRYFKGWPVRLSPMMQEAVSAGWDIQRLPKVAPIALFYSDLR
jgi:hypothetical protein